MSAPLPDELMDRVTAWVLGELAPNEAALEAEAREQRCSRRRCTRRARRSPASH
jgi:hypothetical protein